MRSTERSPPRAPRWPSASLGRYLVVVVLLATVPITALMSWQLFDNTREQHDRLRESLRQTAHALSTRIERELVVSADVLAELAVHPALQQGDIDAFRRVLASPLGPRHDWRGAFVASRDGEPLFDTAGDDARVRLLARDQGAFRALWSGDRLVVSNLSAGAADRPPATAIAVPVAAGGTTRYALGAWIDAEVWRQLLAGGAPPGGYATLVDAEHRVIAHTPSHDRFVGRPLSRRTVGDISAQASGTARSVRPEGDDAELAWQVVPRTDWRIVAGVPSAPIDAEQQREFLLALGTAGVCLLLGVTLALLVARRLTDPLHQLATEGATAVPPRVAVREVALLREALLAAREQDEQARTRLQKKADEFEALFASSPIGLAFAQDRQCRDVLFNPKMIELFGPPDSPEADAARAWHDGKLLTRDAWPLRRAAAEGTATSDFEVELHVPQRAPRFVLASAVPLFDRDGQPCGAIGAVVDITERKLAEARLLDADRRLRESQRLVDLAQEAGHVGFFHYGFADDALAWTPGQAKLFGVEAGPNESSLGEWVRRVDPVDRDRLSKALQRMFDERRERETFEFRVTLPDGGARWLSSRVLVSYGDDGEPWQIVGVTVDLTEQHEVERERAVLMEREQAARIDAERSNRAKDEFLAMLGHELRNPLSAITSAVEVLERDGIDTDVARSARGIIARQARHLTHMMGDLLDVARVMSGKAPLSRQPVDLAALVSRCISTHRMTGSIDHHTVTVDARPVWVNADPTRIEQVVNNLLTNALKYTPEGGRIGVSVSRDGSDALLQVQDDGVGIPAALLPHVFELFVQGERALDRRAGGLGIGLTLVRRLVELHDGSVAAQSGDSGGSTFTVRLPAIEPAAGPREERRLPESRRRHVLLVEDNADALEALRALLTLDGHTVGTATDGESGLDEVLRTRPDVAVIDIGLPKLNGFDLALKSRAGGYTGRMIALSGYGQERDVQQAMRAGFDAHLVKPVDVDALRDLLYDT